MTTVEASKFVPLSPEATWDLLFGDPDRAVEILDDVEAVEDFELRADGTPRYRMVRRLGPLKFGFVSDYSVFERPYRHVNRALESPLEGLFEGTYEPVEGGTRVVWRWDVEPQDARLARVLPLMRPLLRWMLQRDLDSIARAAAGYHAVKAAVEPA